MTGTTPANAKNEITCVRCSDAASQMFRTPGMAYGQTLAPSPPNAARNSKIAQRNGAQSCGPDNDRRVPAQAAAAMRGSGASDNMWGSVNQRSAISGTLNGVHRLINAIVAPVRKSDMRASLRLDFCVVPSVFHINQHAPSSP